MPDLLLHPVLLRIPAFAGITVLAYIVAGVILDLFYSVFRSPYATEALMPLSLILTHMQNLEFFIFSSLRYGDIIQRGFTSALYKGKPLILLLDLFSLFLNFADMGSVTDCSILVSLLLTLMRGVSFSFLKTWSQKASMIS
jgi:hypothetical protein